MKPLLGNDGFEYQGNGQSLEVLWKIEIYKTTKILILIELKLLDGDRCNCNKTCLTRSLPSLVF